jgi:hypothetical protein
MAAPMIVATLADLKTLTRRVAKFEPYEPGINLAFSGLEAGFYHSGMESSGWVLRSRGAGGCWNDRTKPLHSPYGRAGDQLWVRETWAPCEAPIRKGHFQYAADGAVGKEVRSSGGERWWEHAGYTVGVTRGDLEGVWVGKPSRWRPSIHMPRRASRLTLEVISVRLERLCSITEEDAVAEGVLKRDSAHGGTGSITRATSTPTASTEGASTTRATRS